MQGRITISSDMGTADYVANNQLIEALKIGLADPNCTVFKITFTDFNDESFIPILEMMKLNHSVTEVTFENCKMVDKIESHINDIITVPREIFSYLGIDEDNHPELNHPLSLIPYVKQAAVELSSSRNSTLRQVIVNGKTVEHIGLHINCALISWHQDENNTNNLHRYFADYCFAISTQCHHEKKIKEAIHFATHAHKFYSAIPYNTRYPNDHTFAVKITSWLGYLCGTNNTWQRAIEWYNEANMVAQAIPAKRRTDDNWRTLLTINTFLAEAYDTQNSIIDTSMTMTHSISALQQFCNIEKKNPMDYQFAATAANIISDLHGRITKFIYQGLIGSGEANYRPATEIDGVMAELRVTKRMDLVKLLIPLLRFVLNEHESPYFANQNMQLFLRDENNKLKLGKMLVDLTLMQSPEPKRVDAFVTKLPSVVTFSDIFRSQHAHVQTYSFTPTHISRTYPGRKN